MLLQTKCFEILLMLKLNGSYAVDFEENFIHNQISHYYYTLRQQTEFSYLHQVSVV